MIDSFEEKVIEECNDIAQMLLAKNRSYGNSALEPLRIFSTVDSLEGIRIRIDDKLSRVKTVGDGSFGEDTVRDLIGYLILLRVARKQRDEEEKRLASSIEPVYHTGGRSKTPRAIRSSKSKRR